MAKATKKKATPKAKAEEATVPSKLVPAKKSGKSPADDNALVAQAATMIQSHSGNEFVSKGKLNTYLVHIVGVAADTEEARVMVANAFDAGSLKAA